MPPFVRLPLGLRRLSVGDDDVGRRFRGLDAVRPIDVLLLLLHRRHFNFRFRPKLCVPRPIPFLVPKRAERCRWTHPRTIRMHTMTRRTVIRTIRLSCEQTLPRLTRGIAHLRWVVIVDGVDGARVGIVRWAQAAAVPRQNGEHFASRHVAVAVDGVSRLEFVRGRWGTVRAGMGAVVWRWFFGKGVVFVQFVELLLSALTDVLLEETEKVC